ncbi:MAG: fused MFS/spermidine synthase [Desulfatiglans sp.]|nr:fused MFS/spermidine synthase [Desulfatiglans sp.]
MRVNKNLIVWSIIGTGISSVTTQLVTIREFITQFHGNEITIALVLFVWLLFNGAGSLLCRQFKVTGISLYSLLILFIAIWPFPQLIIIRHLRDILMLHGTSAGFYQILLYVGITTAPYAILTGYILPCSLELIKANYHDFTSGELYITDNIGDILGGVIFSFILVYRFNPFKTIAITSGILILISLCMFIRYKKNHLAVVSLMIIATFYIYALNQDFERSTLTGQYGDILKYKETPIGRLVITKEAAQHTFWESGAPLYSTGDIKGSEEKVHYPLIQLDNDIEDILLISGGIGETLSELSKYHPKNIDYVELDPALIDMAKAEGLINDRPGLNIISMDGRAWLKQTRKRYDAIIIDLPDPDTFQMNRFYTAEFFRLTREKLKQNGILSFSVNSYENYISEIIKKKLSSIFNTLTQYYKNVIIIPGGETFFISSERTLNYDIPSLLRKRSIDTEYIQYYYYGNVTNDRINQVRGSIDSKEYMNTDYEPRLLNIAYKEWFSKQNSSPGLFLFVTGLIGLAYIIFMKKEEFILFSSGIAAMSAEMLVIYCFQIIYGYVYLKVGIIVTAFLFGLLPGAIAGTIFTQKKRSELVISEFFILALLICLFIWVNFFKTDLHQAWFILYSILISFFCGFQFPVAAGIIGEKMSPVAGCIAADLAGAALGTLFAGAFLVPLAGIHATIIVVISLKIISSMSLLFSKKI